ncbi:peptidoglycan-binding domain-containing protein [Thiohalorhabdus methylotrophus]|uniref:Peptidoglycan-binding domain-containing protein n=1 Tax=Thiohalorhabdus methylotrophus TaxID=3242694 RepID=A0ABV4U190_9GAMM
MAGSKQIFAGFAIVVLAVGSALAENIAGTQGQSGDPGNRNARVQEGPQLTISPAVVRQIQEKLSNQGFNTGRADGIWSAQSASALADYQQSKGMEPTGQLTIRTLSALGVRIKARTP